VFVGLVAEKREEIVLRALSLEPLDAYWNDVLGIVRRLVQQQTYDTWFLPLEPIPSLTEYKVAVPNHFFLDWFSEHHLKTLNLAISQLFDKDISIALEVHSTGDDEEDLFVPQPSSAFLSGTVPSEPTPPLDPSILAAQANLNPDYTFESFVVSGGTDLAYAAATAVANQPGTHYNPLFIHGGVGLGKTHLMHAIGNAVARNLPGSKVCYLTAEKFMNELIMSIQKGRTPDFKMKYRSMDVLLVDDVSFLAGKESTQDEFFHTFNALHDHKKQIVLTSDRSPKEITTLEERLRSRFEWGLIADIQPPNLETRIAILQRKIETNKIVIPDEVVQYIAVHITDNIRKLEGALIRLLAFASLMRKEITQELASEVLSSYFAGTSAGPVKIADVMEVVANHFEFTVDQLKSKRRTQDLARARQVAMHLARDMTGASLNQIGRAHGGRDHSTVAHACNLICNLSKQDPQYRGMIKDLSEQIRNRARV
jgi:chromosomal replication initiator protein